MHMAILPEGRILLKKIRIGEDEKEPRFLIIPSKDHQEPGKIRRPPPEPPVGEFDPASLEDLANTPRGDGLSYFADLQIQHEDDMEEMLRCLSVLKKILGHRVLVGIPGKPAG